MTSMSRYTIEVDVLLDDQDGVILLTPLSPRARVWCEERIINVMFFGAAYVIEQKFMQAILDGLFASQLNFEYRSGGRDAN